MVTGAPEITLLWQCIQKTMDEGFVKEMSFKSGVKGLTVKMGTVMRWYAQDEVNQEESEQNEVNGTKKVADSTGEVMHN